jgi:TPR repeat protein
MKRSTMTKTRIILSLAGVALACLAAVAVLAGPALAQDPAPAPPAAEAGEAAGPQQVTISFEELLAMLQAEADKQNPRAMLTLGNIWEGGVTIQNRNYGKALEWYQKAADLDMTEAYYHVGVCYEIGMGTPPDLAKALQNFEKASQKGYAPADFKLAVIYLNGAEGVAQDLDRGMRHLNTAADSGLTVALKELGALYYYGRLNVGKNLTKALEIFSKAAEGGDAESMKNLGAMIISGEGRATDKVEGLKWYVLAQEYGYNMPEMQQTIDSIKSGMTADQIATAEAEAKSWSEKFRAEQEAQAQAVQAAAAAAQEAAQQSKPAEGGK